jgi:hypothetical protein
VIHELEGKRSLKSVTTPFNSLASGAQPEAIMTLGKDHGNVLLQPKAILVVIRFKAIAFFPGKEKNYSKTQPIITA